MPKRVLSIGQCGPDHAMLCQYLDAHFGAVVVPACLLDDAIQKLNAEPVDLVMINRKLDADYSDGMAVLKAIKNDPGHAHLPVMMITNYPEHQTQAVAAGAVPGFGKLEYERPETLDKLKPYLA